MFKDKSGKNSESFKNDPFLLCEAEMKIFANNVNGKGTWGKYEQCVIAMYMNQSESLEKI